LGEKFDGQKWKILDIIWHCQCHIGQKPIKSKFRSKRKTIKTITEKTITEKSITGKPIRYWQYLIEVLVKKFVKNWNMQEKTLCDKIDQMFSFIILNYFSFKLPARHQLRPVLIYNYCPVCWLFLEPVVERAT